MNNIQRIILFKNGIQELRELKNITKDLIAWCYLIDNGSPEYIQRLEEEISKGLTKVNEIENILNFKAS